MAFNPLQSVSTGLSSTTPINALIAAINQLMAGLGQSVSAAASSTITLVPGAADVPGASISVMVQGANAFAFVMGSFDFKTTAGAAGAFLLGRLNIDGADHTSQVAHDGAVTGSEAACAGSWIVPLPAGTAHTLKLRASGSAGTSTCGLTHTTITAVVFDIP